MANPTANMQQLVAHWNNIMAPAKPQNKKRRRDDDNERVLKPRTQTSTTASTTLGPTATVFKS